MNLTKERVCKTLFTDPYLEKEEKMFQNGQICGLDFFYISFLIERKSM